MDFVSVVDQAIALLRQRGRLTYRTLQRQFPLDDTALDDLKDGLIYGQRLAVDAEGKVLVWSGATGAATPAAGAPARTPALAPLAYTPPYLAEKILTSRSAFKGERKQVTVLFPVVHYHEFAYQAESWDRLGRVVAKAEWHRGELLPRWGFIVTTLSYPTVGIVRFYNRRGTVEPWIKEGQYALHWTRLSCHKFIANQVLIFQFIMIYNLGNFLRRLALPEAVKDWSLRSVQVTLIKIGGRLVRHARRLVFQLSAVAVPRGLFQGVLNHMRALALAPGE
jgi:Transposase DDE domain group 1